MMSSQIISILLATICWSVFSFNAIAQTELDRLMTEMRDSSSSETERLKSEMWYVYKLTYAFPDSAMDAVQQFVEHSKQLKSHGDVGFGLHLIGYLYSKQPQPDSALAVFRRQRLYCATNNSPHYEAHAHADIGTVYEDLGQLDSALHHYKVGLEVAEARIDNENQKNQVKARCLINIGNVHKTQGNYPLAVQTYQLALDICNRFKLTGYFASLFHSLGDIQLEQNQVELAKSYYEQGLSYAYSKNNAARIIEGAKKIAAIDARAKKYDQALQTLEQALMVTIEKELPIEAAEIRLAKAEILRETTKAEIAQEEASAAFSTIETLEPRGIHAKARVLQGSIALDAGLPNDAVTFCLKGLEVAIRIGDLALERDNCECLYKAYRIGGKPKDALHYHEKWVLLKDSLFNAASTRELTLLEARYEFEGQRELDSLQNAQIARTNKLEHEKQLAEERNRTNLATAGGVVVFILALAASIVLVLNRKKNQRLAQQNATIAANAAQIAKALEEKEVLLKEIHHRVKNNLQVVSGLLELQSFSAQDEKTAALLLAGQHRVKSMALIHQKLYQTDDLAHIDFEEYLSNLIRHIAASYTLGSQTQFHFDVAQTAFDIDTAVPLGLIVNELLSNCFKHAFQAVPEPEIWIALHQTETGSYLLTVRDNGCGLPEGFDWKKSNSLGMKLVYKLARQLHGNAQYRFDAGSVFSVTFEDTQLRKKVD